MSDGIVIRKISGGKKVVWQSKITWNFKNISHLCISHIWEPQKSSRQEKADDKFLLYIKKYGTEGL